jgi:hypothetical protein
VEVCIFRQTSGSLQLDFIFWMQDCNMRQILILAGAAASILAGAAASILAGVAALGVVLAQANGFTVLRTPGLPNQIASTENAPRAAQLRVRCVGNLPEVVLDPKIALNTSQAPTFAWRFDSAAQQQSRFDFVPESGELLLPQAQTPEFLRGLANSSRLVLRLLEPKDPIWEAEFSSVGFRAAFAELPCNAGVFAQSTPAQGNPTMPPAPAKILDATVAFIAPLEFSQIFGGRFVPENNRLVWEYGGKRLLLERGSSTVVDTISNTRLELPRPVQIVENRVVVPVRVVSIFNCSVAQTRPTDAVVRVTCGAGATRIERELRRY